jgi:hypothetical protein
MKTLDTYQVVGIHVRKYNQNNAAILLKNLSLKSKILHLITLSHSSKTAPAVLSLEIRQLILKFSNSTSIS